MVALRVAGRTSTSGLFLGWTKEFDQPVGFAGGSPPAQVAGKPIFYHGDAHALSIGSTGSGKGRSAIIPNLLTYRGPIITVDINGINSQIAARRRRDLGRRVAVLDPLGLLPLPTDTLSPMQLLSMPGSLVDADAEMFASLIGVGHQAASDSYWPDNATSLISALIAHVATTAPPEKRNLNEVRRLMTADDMDYDIALALDKKEVVNRMAREKFVGYLSAPSDKTRPCIRSTALTYIDTFGSDPVQRALGSSTIDLNDVVAGRDLDIFLVFPSDRLESHAAVLRLYLGTLLTAIIRRKQIPHDRTLFLIDEAGQLGSLPMLKQAITLFRGSGLTVWPFFQDFAQIRAQYPHDWETIVNNCGVIQAFGVNTPLAARGLSELLDIAPKYLHRLGRDDQALAIQGRGTTTSRKLDYLRDPVFAGLYDADPRFSLLEQEVKH